MPRSQDALLEPRKSPVQARSAASVDAILDATVQVLLRVGKERLTTTRVAARAGVSVGTLYQYFPNKGALLRTVLRQHLESVADATEAVCREQRGTSPSQMASALVTAFLAAKMRDVRISVALYAISSDVDGMRVVQTISDRVQKAIVGMLRTSSSPLRGDPEVIASIMQGALAGVSRRLVESAAPEKMLDAWREQLIVLLSSYLQAVGSSS